MEIEPSAQVHLSGSCDVVQVCRYLARTRDGQNRPAFECGRDGLPRYKLASQTAVLCPVLANSDYREIMFKLDGPTISFYHVLGFSRPSRYEKIPDDAKKRIE